MSRFFFVFTVFISLTGLLGCNTNSKQAAQHHPLQPIDVAEVLVKPVQSWHTYTTRIESPENVALMPRVSGVINSISFKEGDHVKQGDLLFQLDERPFIAEVTRLKAEVSSAKAALALSKGQADRAQKLLKSNAISFEEAQSRKAAYRQSIAQVNAMRAQLDAALLNVEFTSIRAPINGVISRANITRGNNVTAGQSVLTTIVSNHEMFAYFDIDERTWNKSFSDITADSMQPVVMQKLGQTVFPHSGYVDFIDNRINTRTGTLRVRAVFQNNDNALIDGAFARIKIAENDISKQIIVPTKSIGTDLVNRFVLTVGKNNILEYKLVEIGETYGHLSAITKGLNKGDIIAVNGPARVGPGMPIKPNEITIEESRVAFTLKNNTNQNLAAAN